MLTCLNKRKDIPVRADVSMDGWNDSNYTKSFFSKITLKSILGEKKYRNDINLLQHIQEISSK